MTSSFPNVLDSNLELPQASDNVSEISVDYLNSLRDAIFAIQSTIGTNPQKNMSSLAARINVSIGDDGTLKTTALEAAGLITLPIVNRHVGSGAGIVESKLSLNYSTVSLKNDIDSLSTDLESIRDSLTTNTSSFNLHYLGKSKFHDGYHIRINSDATAGITGLDSVTIGDALAELCGILISGNDTRDPHVDLNLPYTIAHIASKISVDTSAFTMLDRSATTVQSALDSLDENAGILGATHIDTFHANGILKEIKSGTNYNSKRLLLESTSGIAYTSGGSVVTIPGVTSFTALNITAGDILVIPSQSGILDYGNYQIRAIGPVVSADSIGDFPVLAVNEVAVFHTFKEDVVVADAISASIYKPTSQSSQYAPLACAIRNNETITDTISVLMPNAARAVSVGFNGSIINTDGYEIKIEAAVGNSRTRVLTITDLNLERLNTNQASVVDSKSVAERINAFVSNPVYGHHFPITAFSVENELIIAHNWVGDYYTLKIGDGYSANYALGFDAYGADLAGDTLTGSEGNNYVVDGTTLSTIRTAFSGTVSISSATDTFTLLDSTGTAINPLEYGIRAGSVMHVSGHPTLDTNGSYTLLSSNSTTVSTFSVETIDAPDNPTTFSVSFYDSHIPLTLLENTETDCGLVQVYIDSSGQTLLHQRLTYGNSLGSGIEIANISDNFPEGVSTFLVALSGDFIDFNLIQDTIYGETTTIRKDFRGTVKVYHSNGVDYIKVDIVSGAITGNAETIKVSPVLVDDEAFLLCTAHFDGTLSLTSISDRRLFGNLAVNQIRDDFIEAYIQRSNSDIRSDGVVRGFNVLSIAYNDSAVTGMQAVPLSGGVAFVNGVRVVVETQKVIVPSYNSDGTIIGDAKKVIAINEYGSIQALDDDLAETLVDGYETNTRLGKVLPLYYVNINAGLIYDVIDVRRFINDIDDKLDLIIDETNTLIGNFKSLEGALLYAERYPSNKKLTIRIINTVTADHALTVPIGVSIVGSTPYGGDGLHKIISSGALGNSILTLSGNNKLENIEVIGASSDLGAPLVTITGSNVLIDRCLFKFEEAITTNTNNFAIKINSTSKQNVVITDNRINNVYSGIVSEYGVDDLVISDNSIINVCGTGGHSYGIYVGTMTRAVNNTDITNNTIRVPSVVTATDLRGIEIGTGYNIDILKISGNDIVHDSQNTMTNGIRVSTLDGYLGVVDQTFVLDNVIDGIKLDDDDMFGIYISNSSKSFIRGNLLTNIGVYNASRYDVVGIRIASASGFSEITGNTIKSCDLTRGIEIDLPDQTSLVNVSNNNIISAGKNAYYIYGKATNSTITDNTLNGPGKMGIRWSGPNSKISGNNLSRPNTAADDPADDYAFSEYAIYAPIYDIDITDNTITGMVFNEASVGISNGGTARDRVKIINNTICGSLMANMIEIYGTNHIVNSNRLINEALPAGVGVVNVGISLNTVSNSLISGNIFSGVIGYAIDSNSTAVSNLTITNNSVSASQVNLASIRLNGTTTGCLLVGNRIPDGTTYNNTIGADPDFGVYNTNIIGVNAGLQDAISVPACAGLTAFDTSSTTSYSEFPHWIISETNDYWIVNSVTTSDVRSLYFPITGIPNGSQLTSVKIQGKMPALSGGKLTAILKKTSVNSAGATTAISADTEISATDEFFNDDVPALGLIDVTGTSETINYRESNYYLLIKHEGASQASPTDIRIYGVTIFFTY